MMMPFLGLLVLLWTRWSGTPWRDIGYVRPRNWTADIAVGIVLGCAFKFMMKAIVMPLLGADPVNQTYHYLVGNPAMLPGAILTMVAAGFGEETVFRGFLFERLGKLFGSGAGARVAIVLVTTALFASLHYSDQGRAGVEQAVFTGSVFGAILARTGRIWTVMCAHAAFDLTAVAIIYWNLESELAHLIQNLATAPK
jgi:hypothetical protein